MKILLDTHIVLWFLTNNKKLPKETLQAIVERENEKYVSLASIWELAVKINRGRLTFEGDLGGFLDEIEKNGFGIVDITTEQIEHLANLPHIHQDPFDRIMVVQALLEGMFFATADSNIRKYDINCI